MKLKSLITVILITFHAHSMQRVVTSALAIRTHAPRFAHTFLATAKSAFNTNRYQNSVIIGLACCACAYPLYLYAQAYGNYYKNSLNNFLHHKSAHQERIGLAQVLTNHPKTKDLSYLESGIADSIRQFVVPDEQYFQKLACANTRKLIVDKEEARQAFEEPIIVSIPGRIFVIHRLLPVNIAKKVLQSMITIAFCYACAELFLRPCYYDIFRLLFPILQDMYYIKESFTHLILSTNRQLRLVGLYIIVSNAGYLKDYGLPALISSFWIWITGLTLEQIQSILAQANGNKATARTLMLQFVKDKAWKESLSKAFIKRQTSCNYPH